MRRKGATLQQEIWADRWRSVSPHRLVEERLNCTLYDAAELPMPKVSEHEDEAEGGGAKAAAGPIQLPAAKKARAK